MLKEKKLSRRQMVVAVAKDALARLKAGQLQAETGTYLMRADESGDTIPKMDAAEAQKFFQTTRCTVCGLGALFLSKVAKFDGVAIEEETSRIEGPRLGDPDNEGVLGRELVKLLGVQQMELIETAFEGDVSGDEDDPDVPRYISRKAAERAINYCWRDQFADQTLERILKNIIRNKGVFKP